jgi:uncharacterized protein (DUF1697 family)
MSTHVAFLRAINVAGHATIKMTDLTRAFVSAGCEDVRTVIQSGNVLFECDGAATVLLNKVHRNLTKLAGTEVQMMVRTRQDLEAIIKASPFQEYETRRELKCYVAFLASNPVKQPPLPVVSEKEALEILKVAGREVFLLSRLKKNSRMYGFPNGVVESEFGVPATTRNWSTIRKIATLLS